MVTVSVRGDIDCPVRRRMTVFAGMINRTVICSQPAQIRSIHLVDMGLQIDTIRVSVVHDAVFRYDHRIIRSIRQFTILLVPRSASDLISSPRMRVIGAADGEIRSVQNRNEGPGPVIGIDLDYVISGENMGMQIGDPGRSSPQAGTV